MTKLYGQYIQEREGQIIISKDYGFTTYSLFSSPDGVTTNIFIHDFFIVKEDRRSGKAQELANELLKIAIDNKCYSILSLVDISTNTVCEALKFQLSQGLKPSKLVGNLIYMYRRL